MGNSTNVLFVRETVLEARPIETEATLVKSFAQWATDYLVEAQSYKQESPARYYRIMDEIIEQIAHYPLGVDLWDAESLEKYGVRYITHFHNTNVWNDFDLLRPTLSEELQRRIIGNGKSGQFPLTMNTPVRRIIQAADVNGSMLMMEHHEMRKLTEAYDAVKDKLIYDREWAEVVQAHKNIVYDFALFHSLV
jgi:hypothetical protein